MPKSGAPQSFPYCMANSYQCQDSSKDLSSDYSFNFLLFCCRATANQVQTYILEISSAFVGQGTTWLWVITSNNIERNRLNFSLGKVTATDWSSISHDSTQLSSEVENGFILDFEQLQRLQTTNLHYKSWVILFLTSLIMITSDYYLRISEKHLSAVNIEQRTKF